MPYVEIIAIFKTHCQKLFGKMINDSFHCSLRASLSFRTYEHLPIINHQSIPCLKRVREVTKR